MAQFYIIMCNCVYVVGHAWVEEYCQSIKLSLCKQSVQTGHFFGAVINVCLLQDFPFGRTPLQLAKTPEIVSLLKPTGERVQIWPCFV